MNIAFFGSSLLSAYWNGAATYYRGIIRSLHSLGHRITFYEPDAYGRQEHHDIEPPEWARVVVYRPEQASLDECLEAARSADIVVKASGVGVFDVYLESAIPSLGSARTQTIFWDVDAPATLERLERDDNDPFRALVRSYDCILTYGGGATVVQGYEKFGARRCVPIYNALDPSTHSRVEPDERFAADLAFLGNRLPDREARVEEFFFRAAVSLPQHRFLLGGSGWADKPVPSNVHYSGHVYTTDHNAFNSTPMAVLNIHRESMARYGFSPATRVFEAAGAAACLITDPFAGLEMFLEPNHEVLISRSGAETADYIRNLTPERARDIGEAARRRVLAHHTYRHRAAELDMLLRGATAPALEVVA